MKKKGKTTKGDEDHFKKGVLKRKEAVPGGTKVLPPGATHEIVEDEKGKKTLRRRRFAIVPKP